MTPEREAVASKTPREENLRREIARLRSSLATAERERDEARAEAWRLRHRPGELAEAIAKPAHAEKTAAESRAASLQALLTEAKTIISGLLDFGPLCRYNGEIFLFKLKDLK